MKTIFINMVITILVVIGFTGCGQDVQNNEQVMDIGDSILTNRTVDIFYKEVNYQNCDEISALLGLCEVTTTRESISINLDFSDITSSYNSETIEYIENRYTDSNLSLTKRIYFNGDTNETEISYNLNYGKNIYSNLYYDNKSDHDNDSNKTFSMKIYSVELEELNIDLETDENTFFSMFDGKYTDSLSWKHDETVILENVYISLRGLENNEYNIITDKYLFEIELIDGEIKTTNKKDIEYFAFDIVPLNQNIYYNGPLFTKYYSNKKNYFFHSNNGYKIIKNGKSIYDYKTELNYNDKVIFPKENYIFITDDEAEFKKYLKYNNLSNYHLNNYLEDNNISQETYFSGI